MGLTLCKRSCCSCCCCCRPCWLCPCCSEDNTKINSIDVLADVKLKVLLLGQLGSGKTEVGHALSHRPRLDYEPTNGVQYYRVPLARIGGAEHAGGHMAITEIGGNDEMQKIWPHYYAQALAIIYCFDLSASAAATGRTLQLLQQVLRHEFVRGKPVLLVATKSQLVDSGVQLYDVENDFQLERLARSCGSSIRLCSYECASTSTHTQQAGGGSLALGIQWLAKYLLDNWCMLSIRVKCDENAKAMQEQQSKLMAERSKSRQPKQQQQHLGGSLISHAPPRRRRGRFWRFSQLQRLARGAGGRVRPHTAPSRVMTISHECQQQQQHQQQQQQIAVPLSDATTTMTSTIHEEATATITTTTPIITTATSHVSNEVCSGPVPNGHIIKPHNAARVTDIY